MVTCSQCGKENAEGAEFCIRCGDSLREERLEQKAKECFGGKSRPEDECVGLPYGESICGIIFGLIVIVLGWSMIIGYNFWWWIGPLLLLVVGVLIIVFAVYSISRRRKVSG
ncbi:MAG: zinc-ribbon domain-containing protein [Promethearchaeota archaeon]